MSRAGLWFWFKPTPGKRPLKKNVSSGFPCEAGLGDCTASFDGLRT
jgi:hypothetical protein